VARGLGGLRFEDGQPTVQSSLPPGVERVRFAYRFRGSVTEVVLTSQGAAQRVLRAGDVRPERRALLRRRASG